VAGLAESNLGRPEVEIVEAGHICSPGCLGKGQNAVCPVPAMGRRISIF
jgi:hypothetical protein